MAAENYRVSSQHPSVMSMQFHRQSIRPQGQQGYQPELTKQRYIYSYIPLQIIKETVKQIVTSYTLHIYGSCQTIIENEMRPNM